MEWNRHTVHSQEQLQLQKHIQTEKIHWCANNNTNNIKIIRE